VCAGPTMAVEEIRAGRGLEQVTGVKGKGLASGQVGMWDGATD